VRVKADAFTFTTPSLDDAVVACSVAVREVLDAAGASLEYENENGQLFRTPGAGAFHVSSMSRVVITSASGMALDHLRSLGLFGAYLSAVSLEPHRVSTLHAAHDEFVEAAPIVKALFEKATTVGVSLSRKMIPKIDVHKDWSYDDRGVETGTTRLGNRRTYKTYIYGYDKRWERVSKGFPDPGPCCRHELVVKGSVGATLRDVYDPTALFFHYASPDILERPEGVAPWTPYGEGFTMDKVLEATPVQKMKRLVEYSPDVQRLLRYCDEAGPGGLSFLTQLLKQRATSSDVVSGASTHGDSGNPRVEPGTALSAPDRLQ
jgi:hypothetical protein